MDELIKQGQWWWLVAVPVLTGGLALLGSWLGARLGKAHEHKQWSRNQKSKAYSEFLTALNPFSPLTITLMATGKPEARQAHEDEAQRAFSNLMVMANLKVILESLALLKELNSLRDVVRGVPALVKEDIKDWSPERVTQENVNAYSKDAAVQGVVTQIKKVYTQHHKLANAMRQDLDLPTIENVENFTVTLGKFSA